MKSDRLTLLKPPLHNTLNMLNFAKHLSRRSLLGCLLVFSLLLSGCGDGDEATGSTTNEFVLSPKNLVGAVFLITYSDSRAFTFTVTDSVAVGLTRSDGKPVTHWSADGYNTPVLALDIAYGAYTETVPDNGDNVYDYYLFSFTSKTGGIVQIREDVTLNTFPETLVQTGTFTFTTYPPSG